MLEAKYQNYGRFSGKQVDRLAAERLMDTKQVIDAAIELKIWEEFARENGIVVTEDSVVEMLGQRIPPQQRPMVMQALERQGLSFPQFVQQQRVSELLTMAREIMAAKARVSFFEAWVEFAQKNEKLVADVARVNVADYSNKVKVEEAQLKAWFEQNQAKFGIPDQVTYAYILATKDDLRSSVTATNDDITSYYNGNQEAFRLPRAIEARQILLNKPERSKGESDDAYTTRVLAVKARADELYQRAAKGEDFAALADKNTEENFFPPRVDSNTTATDRNTTAGGYLGFVAEPTARNIYGDDWTSTVLEMKPGQLSQPIPTERGMAIVKLISLREGVVQPLEKVRNMIVERVKDEKVAPLFEQQGAKWKAASDANPNLEKLAATLDMKVTTTTKMDKSSRFIPGIGLLGTFQEAVTDLQRGGRSEVMSDESRHLVLEIREEIPAHSPKLDEVRDRVTSEFKETKAREMAKADAEKIKARSTTLEGMRTAAKDLGLTVTRTAEFTRTDSASQIGPVEDFSKQTDGMRVGEFALSRLGTEESPTGYVVWHLEKKVAPSRKEFADQLPKIMNELAMKKAEIMLNEYVRDRKRELSDRIEIDPRFR
jgi:peptidyl-prolyl cis-trans isomerase D